MSDFIKRSDAIDAVNMNSRRKSDILYRIKHIPSEDAVSVVHGKWIVSYTDGIKQTECSACGESFTTYDVYGWNYCPWCGAEMKGADDEVD